MPPKVPLIETIRRKHVKCENGCWHWTGHIEITGYGRFRHDGKNYLAHRASWIAHNGNIPNGLLVLHKCDVPRCINPSHMFLGTHLDNMIDMRMKGRDRRGPRGSTCASKGESHHRSKLTNDQVIEIRKSCLSQKQMSNYYGVTVASICKILHRKTWKHLD